MPQVVNSTRRVTATVTRPTDTTQYAAGDALSDSDSAPTNMTFSDCARNLGKGGVILDAYMIVSVAAATDIDAELWLFHTAPAAVEDNAAYDPSDSEILNVVAVIPFTTGAKTANNEVYRGDVGVAGFVCVSTSTDLYGQVVVRNAYTPTASEVYTFILNIAQD